MPMTIVRCGMANILGLLFIITMVGILANLMAEDVAGYTPPPDDGDWVVSDMTTIVGGEILLNGSLTVTGTGHLNLIGVVLKINSTTAMDRGILVESGGYLLVIDGDNDPSTKDDASKIRSNNSFNRYTWLCEAGSHLIIRSSIISDCGGGYNRGLTIWTDDARISNSTFFHCNYGINVMLSSPRIEDSIFYGNRIGIYLTGGSARVDRCTFNGSSINAIYAMSTDNATIRNCTIDGNVQVGIAIAYGWVRVEDCRVQNTTEYGIRCTVFSKGYLARCTVNDSKDLGIYIDGHSSIKILDCEIFDIVDRGLWIEDSECTVIGTSIHGCQNDSVYIFSSIVEIIDLDCWGSGQTGILVIDTNAFQIEDSAIYRNGGYGIFIGSQGTYESVGWVRDCRIYENARTGIYVRNDCTAYIDNGTFWDNEEYAIYTTDNGHASWSVNDLSFARNESMRIQGDIDVRSGGDLTLENTTVVLDTRFKQVGFSEIRVNRGILRLVDGDGDRSTGNDATLITILDDGVNELNIANMVVTVDSSLIARNSMFEMVSIHFDYFTPQVYVIEGCEFDNSDIKIIAPFDEVPGVIPAIVKDSTFTDQRSRIHLTRGPLTIDGCTFVRCEEAIKLTNGTASISNTSLIGCDIGINITLQGTHLVDNTRIINCGIGIEVKSDVNLVINGTEVRGSTSHGVRAEFSKLTLRGSEIRDSGVGGLVFDRRCTVVIDNCSIHSNGWVGIRANYTTLYMTGTSVTGTNGIGIWLTDNATLSSADRFIMRDCYIDTSAAYDVRLEEMTIGMAFNTHLDPENVRVMDQSHLELWYDMKVKVMVAGEEPIPPGPIDYQVSDSMGRPWDEGTMTDPVYLPVIPAMAYRITPEDIGANVPYNVTVTVAGRDWSGLVDLDISMETTIVVWPDLQAMIQVPDTIYEGEEFTLIASDSVGYPFYIAGWEWDLDPETDPGIDETGAVVRWTFTSQGRYLVRLNITDKVGNGNWTEFFVEVLDTGPTVWAEPMTPDPIVEDETINFTGGLSSYDGVLLREWSFGDGSRADGDSASHSWAKAGTYNVTYTVYQDDGNSASAIIIVTVTNVAPVAAVAEGTIVSLKADPVFLDASPSNDTASDYRDLIYHWDLGDDATMEGVQGSYRFKRSGTFTVTLTVTDDDGEMDVTTVMVTIVNVPPTMAVIPDITMNNTDETLLLRIDHLISDPDDTEFFVEITTPEIADGPSRVVRVEAFEDEERGWTLRIITFADAEGKGKVTLEVYDLDGGVVQAEFHVTVVDDSPGLAETLGDGWPFVLIGVIALVAVTVVALYVYLPKRRKGDGD
jgi:PKD repeat protein